MVRFLTILAALFFVLPAYSQNDKLSNFVYVDASTHKTILSIYARRLGQSSALLSAGSFFNFNDRDHKDYSYKEYYAGITFDFGNDKAGLWPFIVYSSTSDGDYIQLWAYPYFKNKEIWVNAFLGEYVPLSPKGEPQFFTDKLRVSRPVTNKVGVGVAYRLFKINGYPAEQSLGPSMTLDSSFGSVSIDFLRGIGNEKSRIAGSYSLMF